MNLFKILDLSQIRKQFQIETYSLVDFTVGFDDLIYLLFAKNTPNWIDGMFINTKVYVAVVALFDWKLTSICNVSFYNLGILDFDYNFIRPIENYIMLLGARCEYHNKDNIDQNVLLLDANGVSIKKLCFGDGVENCITTADGKIIVSYFDEGVLGNYGWKNPIGASGLIAWGADGNITWKNNTNDILDCYAINIDSQCRLWFYYYLDFNLVCTDFKSCMVMRPDITGSKAFAVSARQKQILFSGGYNDLSFYQCNISPQQGIIEKKKRVDLRYLGHKIEKESFHFCGSKLLFLIDDNICGYDYI